VVDTQMVKNVGLRSLLKSSYASCPDPS